MAELTAAAFGTARVPPLLGRALAEFDDIQGAPGVVVLRYNRRMPSCACSVNGRPQRFRQRTSISSGRQAPRGSTVSFGRRPNRRLFISLLKVCDAFILSKLKPLSGGAVKRSLYFTFLRAQGCRR
jgi:hypothetical protein